MPGTSPRRTSQRPPAGDWRVWGYVAGRGAGKTRAGACWVQHRVETGVMKLGCLIAPTVADIRDVMVYFLRSGDLIDALRGGIRDAFPEGLGPRPKLLPVHAARVLG